MHKPQQDEEIAFRTTHRKQCAELQFVLAAGGIQSATVHHEGQWLLLVRHDDLTRATAELETYRRENPESVVGERSSKVVPVTLHGGASISVVLYLGVLVLIHVCANQRAFGLDWYQAGQMRAGSVMAGQWWRIVTALTLHLDLEHLLSNLLFGTVFGFLAVRILGGGVAWLAIVLAGALGNFMNAVVQSSNHLSIGASTAVFAALGLIVSHSLRTWTTEEPKATAMKRWSPLVGGALLFAYLGIGGERTDVLAHVTGFLAGLLIGWIGCRTPERWLSSTTVQRLAGFGAIVLVSFAWAIAFFHATSPP